MGKPIKQADSELLVDNTRLVSSENSGEHWRFCLRCAHELLGF